MRVCECCHGKADLFSERFDAWLCIKCYTEIVRMIIDDSVL
jgi:hypothetical protein